MVPNPGLDNGSNIQTMEEAGKWGKLFSNQIESRMDLGMSGAWNLTWERDNLGCSKQEAIVILEKFPVTASHSRDSGGVRGARMICHFSLLNPLIILSSHLIETDVSFSEVTIWRQHTIICLMVYFWVIYHLDQNHPDSIQLGSCEKFQPFWDCFNELFIKPITSDQESQTSPICRVLSADHIRASDRVRAGQGFYIVILSAIKLEPRSKVSAV